jgi:hypothetical protein
MEHGQEVVYRNTPADKTGYEMFRRVVTHLSTIQDQNQLYAEPLVYHRTWTIPANSVTAEGFQSLQKEYLVPIVKKTIPIQFANKSWDERSSPTMTQTRSHQTNELG